MALANDCQRAIGRLWQSRNHDGLFPLRVRRSLRRARSRASRPGWCHMPWEPLLESTFVEGFPLPRSLGVPRWADPYRPQIGTDRTGRYLGQSPRTQRSASTAAPRGTSSRPVGQERWARMLAGGLSFAAVEEQQPSIPRQERVTGSPIRRSTVRAPWLQPHGACDQRRRR